MSATRDHAPESGEVRRRRPRTSPATRRARGWLRSVTGEPAAVRRALRSGVSPSLRRRRWIGALSALGVTDFAIISLYQIGVLRRLPDLPGRVFDSNRVNASRHAYATGVPDGALGGMLYATTLALAAAGGDGSTRPANRREGRHIGWDVLLAGATLAGSLAAARYLDDMVRRQQRACPYCLVGAAASFASLALAAGELHARTARSSPVAARHHGS
jgi:uncharacterized membrane protein